MAKILWTLGYPRSEKEVKALDQLYKVFPDGRVDIDDIIHPADLIPKFNGVMDNGTYDYIVVRGWLVFSLAPRLMSQPELAKRVIIFDERTGELRQLVRISVVAKPLRRR
ncbi:MAG: hypothetical protein ACK4SY_08200 [Pyrobaculum sp.]